MKLFSPRNINSKILGHNVVIKNLNIPDGVYTLKAYFPNGKTAYGDYEGDTGVRTIQMEKFSADNSDLEFAMLFNPSGKISEGESEHANYAVINIGLNHR